MSIPAPIPRQTARAVTGDAGRSAGSAGDMAPMIEAPGGGLPGAGN
jgi:hypothetical protein